MKYLKIWLTSVDTRARGRSTSLALGLLIASFWTPGASWAGDHPPRDEPDPQAAAEARAHAGAQADANAQAEGGNAQADAQGGQAASSSSADGSNNSTTQTSNESNFFALATTFPQVSGCFKGRQGGAAGSGTGIWFGGHGLDLNCFMTTIAEAEPDIEVAARLKCASKAFRNAIAFEVKKSSERQLFCVNYMTEKHRNELSALRERAEYLLEERDRIEHELTERNTLLQRQCAEQIDRSEEAWLECLAK
jgi:hypothetical protein